MNEYFKDIEEKVERTYKISKKVRSLGRDPETDIEALPAGDLATRVEGLVGPKGIALKIKELGRENIPDIIDYILGDTDSLYRLSKPEKEKLIDQALRTSLAIITEGVVAAPLEGISRVSIEANPDGSEYLSIYFAGPIRSAGGTAQGLAVLIGDYIRREFNLQEYRPTKDEVERYVEEIKIYNERVSRLQYLPSDDDIRKIVNNMVVCVDGEPTERLEVSVHRDLERVNTNRIRGGVCLVIAEGIAQKAKKMEKYANDWGLDWHWLSRLGKDKKIASDDTGLKAGRRFMSEIVGGRPVFAAPSAKGAFRLRYGKSRTSGIAAKSINPATMILLDEFIATGTQIKVEKPGKGCIITPCDTIEGPIVRLRNGSVIRVDSVEKAISIKNEVDNILFLGDILITYGDFLQTNTPLQPAGYCEEWWLQDAEKVGVKSVKDKLKPEDAIEISIKYGIPLHPRYTYNWEDISIDELETLVDWLSKGKINSENDKLELENNSPDAKKILEFLCVPHTMDKNTILIDEYKTLLLPLGIYNGKSLDFESYKSKLKEFKTNKELTVFDFIREVSPVRIRPKVGTYIGARMGRPEKARERKMQPPVHSLFPIGEAGGSGRNIRIASGQKFISVEIARYECPKCRTAVISPVCPKCSSKTIAKRICPSCKTIVDSDTCHRCRRPTQFYEKQSIDLETVWRTAIDNIGLASEVTVKGVKGMISKYKIPEPLEKGILRAKNDVYVFKDGTIRFDATDAPLTHFKPREINVSVEKLRELGYTTDYKGNDLVDEEQILELKVQDIIIPEAGADYLLRVSKFIDDLLEKFYHMDKFYNADKREDLLGHLIVGLAPHTSAGIVGRIVGFTKASVCYAHPFWHAAKRRNCDGDEDSIMLMLDTLINFSQKYLPETRGGKMDAPLVITTILDPKEVDDEAHKIEILGKYPSEFYEETWKGVNPSEAKITIVNSVLSKNPYNAMKFTHNSTDINGPVLESKYVRLKAMRDKVKAQLGVAEKIRAIGAKDVAELVINSHFLRDTYGNLKAFSRQKFRCVKCNASYRRIPLIGKCTRCGGKLLLTVTEGSVKKYLDISLEIGKKYKISDYIKQRLILLRNDIDSLFANDLAEQKSLSDFM
ncbi:MAG TPA: DNA polymerase II large subunit [Candidatus Altiarchaeales archaeon]|nr:DNA polymerase II large subunit [Candidatus Altiarchaeales archaeon]